MTGTQRDTAPKRMLMPLAPALETARSKVTTRLYNLIHQRPRPIPPRIKNFTPIKSG